MRLWRWLDGHVGDETVDVVCVHQVWCHGCGAYQTLNYSKTMIKPATMLIIHCNASTEAELDLWRTKEKTHADQGTVSQCNT